MEPTFESIKAMIVHEVWTGNQVSIKFKATNQDQPLETMGFAMQDQAALNKKIMAEAGKTAASGMAVGIGANMLGGLTGVPGAGSAIGSVANSAGLGYQMDANKLMQVDVTEDVRQQTILTAFKNLTMFYHFENGVWVYKQPTY